MENDLKQEKVKITQKEFDEIYDIIPDIEDTKNIPEEKQEELKEDSIDGVSNSDLEYMRTYDKQTVEEPDPEEGENALSEV